MQGAAAIGFFGLPQGAGGEIRQLQAITPFLIVLAAAGLVQLWDWSVLGRGLVIALAIQFLLFCGLYQSLLIDALVVAPPDSSADIQALRQVAPNLDPDTVLMSRKPDRAAHYANHPAVIMPLAGFRDLMTYAQAHHVTHLVVTPRELRNRAGLGEGLALVGKSVELLLEVDNTQILEVHDYEFLPAIEEGGPLDQEIDLAAPMPPPDWRALLRRATLSTLDQIQQTWQRWLGSTP